jgi:hypothetical protein
MASSCQSLTMEEYPKNPRKASQLGIHLLLHPPKYLYLETVYKFHKSILTIHFL